MGDKTSPFDGETVLICVHRCLKTHISSKLVTVVISAISASVNSYRLGLLKIRSKTNRGVPKLFSSVIVSPIILWTDIQALSLAIFSLACSAGGRYWCTTNLPSLNLCIPAKNTNAHADAQVWFLAIHVFIWFWRTYRAKRTAPDTLPPIEFNNMSFGFLSSS